MKKLAFTCFVDNQARYKKQAIRFIYSLLRAGKSIDDIFVCLSNDIEPEYRQLLTESIGISKLSTHTNFTSVSKPANKWLQLDKIAVEGYTHVIMNDCDKVYVDFDDNWATESVRACKFVPRPTFAVFQRIFDHFALGNPRFTLDHPDPRDEAKDPRNYVNNHNGGLIIIPLAILPTLTRSWKQYIDLLLQNIDLLGANDRNLDQVAFAMAMQSLGEDINHLPKSLDIGIGVKHLSSHLLDAGSGQLVLHIHADEDDSGLIVCRPNTDQNLRNLVADFNRDYQNWISTVNIEDYVLGLQKAA